MCLAPVRSDPAISRPGTGWIARSDSGQSEDPARLGGTAARSARALALGAEHLSVLPRDHDRFWPWAVTEGSTSAFGYDDDEFVLESFVSSVRLITILVDEQPIGANRSIPEIPAPEFGKILRRVGGGAGSKVSVSVGRGLVMLVVIDQLKSRGFNRGLKVGSVHAHLTHLDHCRRQGLRACFYQPSPRHVNCQMVLYSMAASSGSVNPCGMRAAYACLACNSASAGGKPLLMACTKSRWIGPPK